MRAEGINRDKQARSKARAEATVRAAVFVTKVVSLGAEKRMRGGK